MRRALQAAGKGTSGEYEARNGLPVASLDHIKEGRDDGNYSDDDHHIVSTHHPVQAPTSDPVTPVEPREGRSATRRNAEEGEGVIVQDGVGRPIAVAERKEDWELHIAGYSERMGRPIVSGWSRRDLQDKAPDLERVEYQVTYMGGTTLHGRDHLEVREWTLPALVSRDSDEDAGGGSHLGPH